MFLSSHPSLWKVFVGLRKDIAIQRLAFVNATTFNEAAPRTKYKKLVERLSRAGSKQLHRRNRLNEVPENSSNDIMSISAHKYMYSIFQVGMWRK